MKVSKGCRHGFREMSLARWLRHPNHAHRELVFTVTITCDRCGREFHGEVG